MNVSLSGTHTHTFDCAAVSVSCCQGGRKKMAKQSVHRKWNYNGLQLEFIADTVIRGCTINRLRTKASNACLSVISVLGGHCCCCCCWKCSSFVMAIIIIRVIVIMASGILNDYDFQSKLVRKNRKMNREGKGEMK